MRVNRILVSIIAVALMGLAPASVSSASAAPAAETSTASAAAVKTSARAGVKVGAKVCRRDQAGCPGRGRSLVMFGVVSPRTGPANIQRCIVKPNLRTGACRTKWRTINKVNVNPIKGTTRGRYASPVSAPANGSWYWRTVVRGNKSGIWETFRR